MYLLLREARASWSILSTFMKGVPVTDQNDAPAVPEMTPASEGNIRIFMTSTSDTGFADFVELPAGSTIKDFWDRTHGGHDASKYVIRCERFDGGRMPASFVLQDGDRVTVSPHKVAGAELPGFTG